MSAPFSRENARDRAELCAERAREERDRCERLMKDVCEEQDPAKRMRMIIYAAVCQLRAETDEHAARMYTEAAEK